MDRSDAIMLQGAATTLSIRAEAIRARLADEARTDGLKTTDEAAAMAAKLVDAADELAAYLREIREQA
jgi:hypothetical protein